MASNALGEACFQKACQPDNPDISVSEQKIDEVYDVIVKYAIDHILEYDTIIASMVNIKFHFYALRQLEAESAKRLGEIDLHKARLAKTYLNFCKKKDDPKRYDQYLGEYQDYVNSFLNAYVIYEQLLVYEQTLLQFVNTIAEFPERITEVITIDLDALVTEGLIAPRMNFCFFEKTDSKHFESIRHNYKRMYELGQALDAPLIVHKKLTMSNDHSYIVS